MPDLSSSPPVQKRTTRWTRWPLRFLVLIALLLLGPIGVLAFGDLDLDTPWYRTRQESTGQAPDPAVDRGAVVQVYGVRIVRGRGAFGIHPWIAVKRAGADRYTTDHIIGWRARRGGDAMVTNDVEAPDMLWYGAYPQLLADHRGAEAEAMIDPIETAVAAYPWRESYRLWPGPNSNTFVAWVPGRYLRYA